jgi:hypothetical protein
METLRQMNRRRDLRGLGLVIAGVMGIGWYLGKLAITGTAAPGYVGPVAPALLAVGVGSLLYERRKRHEL